MNAVPENAKPEPGTKYALNYNFKSKKVKINLNIAIKSESKQEVEDTHKTIEEDRKLLMQVSTLFFSRVFELYTDIALPLVRHCPHHEVP